MDLEDIAGYSLRRKLGSGSAGTVWQVRDLASGRNAVLKRVPITAIPDQEKLREDLTILQRIRHPHIACLLEFRETGTEWLIISQYVVAGSLAALLTRRPPLSPGELVTLLTPLAEALDHLHRSGLTHGRLTPTNTLFDADGRPILTDTALHLHEATAPSPTDDLRALATLAHQAGGNPAVFTPTLFTTTPPHDLPRHLLTLSAPAPIDLAFPQDPPPPTPATPNPPPTDDPLERSRTPLTPPPPNPSSPPPPQPTKPHPPTPTKLPNRPRRPRRTLRRPTGRTPPATPFNPLTRLTPPTPTAPFSPTPPPTPPSTPVTEPPATPPTPTAERATKPAATPPTSTAAGGTVPAGTPLASTSALATTPAASPPTSTTARVDAPAPAPPTAASAFAATPAAISPTSTSTRASAPGTTPTRPDRPRTRRHPWRRNQVLWRRLAARLPHPTYGVLAATALGAVIVLLIGIATVSALNTANTSAAADNQPTTPPTPADATTPPASTTATTSIGATTPPVSTSATTPTTRLPTTAGSRTEATDWATTLRALDVQRAHAFWTLDPDVLDKIYVPGTPPWQADRNLLAAYRKQRVRVQGLRIQIDKATIAQQTPTTVTLKTTDHLTAGQAIDHTGTSTPLPPGTPTTRLITLTKTPTPRITTITPA